MREDGVAEVGVCSGRFTVPRGKGVIFGLLLPESEGGEGGEGVEVRVVAATVEVVVAVTRGREGELEAEVVVMLPVPTDDDVGDVEIEERGECREPLFSDSCSGCFLDWAGECARTGILADCWYLGEGVSSSSLLTTVNNSSLSSNVAAMFGWNFKVCSASGFGSSVGIIHMIYKIAITYPKYRY